MKNLADRFSLKGKAVHVVGGTGLLGTAIVKSVAESGGHVLILDVNEKKGKALAVEIKKKGQKADFSYFDLADLDSAESSLENLTKRYGMDVWINAAYPRTKDWAQPLEKMSLGYLKENVDLQLNSCIWTSRKAALLMKKNKVKGSIIHLGSIYGVQANDLTVYEGTPMTGEAIYCAVKAGIHNFTRYLASHFGSSGIRANCICPGGIFDDQNKNFVKNYEHKVPLKRMGTPEDVASVALFLASDASSYMTGSAVMVDGGWTII